MPKVVITKMSIKKGVIEIKEASLVDDKGFPKRKITLNEQFAVALRGSIIDLNMVENE